MRIAIANDTPMAVEALKRVVLSVPEHEIAWIAENGEQAVEQARLDVPDLILMDLIMPVMDGVEATRQIMQHSPCVILVVTADVSGRSGKVFDAMGAGAMDAVNTPILGDNKGSAGAGDLLQKIYTLGKLIAPGHSTSQVSTHKLIRSQPHHDQLLVMGASTGGPNAIATILSVLSEDFPVPIVIVQHVDKQFVLGLTDWLADQIKRPVNLAKPGDQLTAGCVFVADPGKHIQVSKTGSLSYVDEPRHYAHKPSINVLFESVASNWQGHAVGVLLTGMGKDGAAGLLAMRDRGFCTIAQDEASCAVYGMPRTAVELDAADIILSLDEIGPALNRHFMNQKQSRVAGHE
ncbi:MAG: chemotaxis response regulator protein-glutamate methylesterase [Thioalkalispiraceae bacterium]|jgi:two-component system response regulator WspF